ncbi:HRSL1 enzyme, partial [Chloropsis hardwickii]|nr:HRSL1 enzyme [Chloropsis hardwickii]
LIEIFWPIYQHWALYMGDGYVIHVTDHSDTSSTISICTVVKGKKELLEEVAGNHKWRVNNKYDRSHTPRPVQEIIRSAEQWIDKEVPYEGASTSERFVTKLRYGKALPERVSEP